MKSPIILSLGILFGLTSSAMAAGEFVYEGVLTDANDQAITLQSAVQVNIYNDSATCLLSMHAMQVTPDGKGYFTVVISDLNKINGGNVSSVSDIFKSSTGNCSSSSDIRKLEFVVNGETLSPKISLRPVPAAYKAQKVGDIDASSVLFVGGQSSGSSLTANDLSVIRNLITNASKIVSSDGSVGTSVSTANGNYVTTSTLSSYVTTSALNTTLGGYVTSSSLSTTLGGYVQSSALSSYATTTSLGSYLTTATASTTYAEKTHVVSSVAGSGGVNVSAATGAVTLSFDPTLLADGSIPASKVAGGGGGGGGGGNAGGILSVTGDAVISAVNNAGAIDLSFNPSGIAAGGIPASKVNISTLGGVSSITNPSSIGITSGGSLNIVAPLGVIIPSPSASNHAATKAYVDSRSIASFSEGSADATLSLTSSINNSVVRVQLGSSKISLQDDDMPSGGSVFIKNTQGGSVAVDAGAVSIDGSAVKCITLPSQGSIQLHKVSTGTVEILASHGGVTVDATPCQ